MNETAGIRKSKSLLATATLALVALAYVFFVFLPQRDIISQKRRELDDKQRFLRDSERLGESIKIASSQLTLANDYIQAWDARSPTAATLADCYERLSTAASEAGVTITKFAPQPVESLQRICQHPIHLAVEGQFEQVVKLLHEVESLETTIWVASLSIEPLAHQVASRGARRSEGNQEFPQFDADPAGVHCQMTLHVFADKSKFSD